MSNNRYKVLVVEDETNIRSFMQAILEANDFQVLNAETGSEAEMMVASYCPDLILLDLGLPDMDGQALIKSVRCWCAAPIIVVSARAHETDKVAALDLGANDYVTKPFGTAELLARVRAALRNRRHSTGDSALPGRKFASGDLVIDYDKRRLTIAGEEVELTQTEYNIVDLLSQYAGKVLTYDAIIRAIWGSGERGGIKKLQVNMANIRKKMGSKPGATRYICTEMGVGYRMLEDEE